MHLLEAYYSRETAMPSTTQTVLAALERGAEVYVTCHRCEGSGRLLAPRKSKKGRLKGTCCPVCYGRGRRLQRYDAALDLWREGMAEQTRRCTHCLGVPHDGTGERCTECGGRGYVQAVDALPHVCPEVNAQAMDSYNDKAIDLGWMLGRLPAWVQEVVELWFRPDAVAYRAQLGGDPRVAGHAWNAPLLPLTYLGRLAYALRRAGDTARSDALVDAALAEAGNLRAAAFRELNDWQLARRLSGGTAKGRDMREGRP